MQLKDSQARSCCVLAGVGVGGCCLNNPAIPEDPEGQNRSAGNKHLCGGEGGSVQVKHVSSAQLSSTWLERKTGPRVRSLAG